MIPRSHPRYASLMTREDIVKGVEKGITSLHGLIAQGRGEAFDYLLGEKTHPFSKEAIKAAASLLKKAKHPVISVNGNVAALVPGEIVRLSKAIPAKIEINIFHASKKRENVIRNHLKKHGTKEILMPSKKHTIKFIDHNRKYANKEGILKADVVFVPLEDGDRCKALVKNGKKVITVDLNPMSRTSQAATITIVDNIIRVMPLLIKEISSKNKAGKYDNRKILKEAIRAIRK